MGAVASSLGTCLNRGNGGTSFQVPDWTVTKTFSQVPILVVGECHATIDRPVPREPDFP
jgi:hypothetical protein